MNMLNKLFIQQRHIFLAPGNYIHPDFNQDGYNYRHDCKKNITNS